MVAFVAGSRSLFGVGGICRSSGFGVGCGSQAVQALPSRRMVAFRVLCFVADGVDVDT